MPIVKLGFVTAAGVFADFLSEGERKSALRPYEVQIEGEAPELRPDLIEQYAQQCAEAMRLSLARRGPAPRTLRTDQPYGYADHERDWLYLGCRLVADVEEALTAYTYLLNPEAAGLIETEFTSATRRFLEDSLPRPLFTRTDCAFHLLNAPEPE